MQSQDIPDFAMLSGSGQLWTYLAILLVVSVFTALRVYVRAYMARNMAADDWLLILATILLIVTCGINMHGAVVGAFDRARAQAHQRTGTTPIMTPPHRMAFLKSVYICQVLYPPITLCVRLSVCLFLLRIVHRQPHRRILHALMGMECLVTIAYFLIVVYQCDPPWFYWTRVLSMKSHGPGTGGKGHHHEQHKQGPDHQHHHHQHGRCQSPVKMAAAGLVHAIMSAITAFVVGVFPVYVLWTIQMNWRTKATVIVLLGMSLL